MTRWSRQERLCTEIHIILTDVEVGTFSFAREAQTTGTVVPDCTVRAWAMLIAFCHRVGPYGNAEEVLYKNFISNPPLL